MADFPDEIVTAAAEALHRDASGGPGTACICESPAEHAVIWAEDIAAARRALNAVAAQLGEHVAGKIGQHRDRHMPGGSRASAWRRHFGICARIAARAFLTEDDVKAMARQAIERGDYAACTGLEGDEPVL